VTTTKRRTWFRFSLRTLLILSFLIGSVFLLWPKRPAWRLDMVLETTDAKGTGKSYVMGGQELIERDGKRFSIFKNDLPYFEFDFLTIRDPKTYVNPDGTINETGPSPIVKTLSPDLTKMLVADEYHARLYDLSARKLLHEWTLFDATQKYGLYFPNPIVHFSDDGTRIAVIRETFDELVLLNAETGGITSRFPAARARRCDFTPDGKRMCLERTGGLDVRELDGKLVFSESYEVNRYWTQKSVQFLDMDVSGKTTHCMAFCGTNKIEFADVATGTSVKEIPILPGEKFEGFSAHNTHFYTSLACGDLRGNTHYAVRDTRTGDDVFRCAANGKFESPSWDSFDSSLISTCGDYCIVTHTTGSVRLWRLSSNQFIGKWNPNAMTSRSPLIEEPHVIIITCMRPSRASLHTIARSGSTSSNQIFATTVDAIFTEGPHRSATQKHGEIQRDFILRRNHPEEWWGLAWTLEFAFATVLMMLLIWSLVRDWRELGRRVLPVERVEPA